MASEFAFQDRADNETGFVVEARAGLFAAWQVAASPSASAGTGAVNIPAPGMSAGRVYTFRVRAITATGDSPWSNEARVATPP